MVITFTRLRAVRRKGVNQRGRWRMSGARFTACHLPWTADSDCACLSPGERTQRGKNQVRNEQEHAATTERVGAKRRCPSEARQHYRRTGGSGASVYGCRKRDVDVATVRWKPGRAETACRLRLRQRRFPSGKSPGSRHNGKKNRQDSNISQYGIDMTTIANSNSMVTRTGKPTPSCSTMLFRTSRDCGIRQRRRNAAPEARRTPPAGVACQGFARGLAGALWPGRLPLYLLAFSTL